MYHEYPYTTYYNDLDRMCKCCKALNIHLDTHGDYLRLINDKDGSVISAVKVSYADTALTDMDGNPIKSYLINAGTNGTHLVFTKGNNEVISFEVPFAKTAAKDVQEKDILDYVYGVSISGDKVRITNGDATIYELTIPFATKAATDINGKDLTTYAATLVVDGNELVLKDSNNSVISRITVPYATKAKEDVDGDDIKSTYANSMTQTSTTLKLLAKDGTVLDEETINYATMSLKDINGNLFLSDYADKIVVDADGKRIGVEAHDGTRLATITVPFATLSTDATNAVESVQVSGDQIIFTTYGGQTFSITAPYAVKAQKDDNGNTIKSTYFAGVSNDTDAGTITFYDALGQVLAVIQNGVITHAIYDDYDNPLAGYIKSVQATAGSDYLTATHGDGTVDSIKVDYSERAWKDTNGNIIKNTYVKRLAIVEDTDDHKWKLLAFNGDNPEALLFALEIVAERAKKDMNGKLLTSYVAHIDTDGDDVISKDGEDQEVDRITVPYATKAKEDVAGKDLTTYLAHASLDGTDLVTEDGSGQEVDRVDLSKLPYGVSLSVTADKKIELIDPAGTVLSTIQVPTANLKPIEEITARSGQIIAVYGGGDNTFSSPIATRKVDAAPTLAAGQSYWLMIGQIKDGAAVPFTSEGQRYFPSSGGWYNAAGLVDATEEDLSYIGLDPIYDAITAKFDAAIEKNSSVGGATLTDAGERIVRYTSEALDTKLDKYVYVGIVRVVVGSSPVTLDWSSDYSADVEMSSTSFHDNASGTLRYDWSLN